MMLKGRCTRCAVDTMHEKSMCLSAICCSIMLQQQLALVMWSNPRNWKSDIALLTVFVNSIVGLFKQTSDKVQGCVEKLGHQKVKRTRF